MNKIFCPICETELIKLNFEEKCHEFWCNHCNIDITIQENEKEFNPEEIEINLPDLPKCPTCGKELEFDDCYDSETFDGIETNYCTGYCTNCGKNFQWEEVSKIRFYSIENLREC